MGSRENSCVNDVQAFQILPCARYSISDKHLKTDLFTCSKQKQKREGLSQRKFLTLKYCHLG